MGSWSYYTEGKLRAIGVSCHSPDYSEVVGPPRKLKAYCTSRPCVKTAREDAKVPKDIKKWRIMCPDCGHALLWKAAPIDPAERE